jgi:hypothetical protein
MIPLWKLPSGSFAGWRRGDALYDASGNNVGYFVGEVAFSNSTGAYIGEISRGDWIGKRSSVLRGIRGPRISYVGLAVAPHVDRVGLAIAGWEDPDF